MEQEEVLVTQALEKLNAYLEEHKCRKTAERVEILKAVIHIGTIFTIDELNDYMQSNSIFTVSRGTIGNAMEVLEKAHLVIRHVINRTFQYEFGMGNKPMIYELCDNCGQIKHLDKKEISQFLHGIHDRQFSIKQPVLYLHGLCKKCEKSIKRKERRLRMKQNTIQQNDKR